MSPLPKFTRRLPKVEMRLKRSLEAWAAKSGLSGSALSTNPAPTKVLPAKGPGLGSAGSPVPRGGERLGLRFQTWRPAVEAMLQRNNVLLPGPVLQELVRHVNEFAGNEALASLSADRIRLLLDSMRQRMLQVGSAIQNPLLQDARRRARIAFGARGDPAIDLVSVPVNGGLWLFVVPSAPGRRHVVLHEAFAPTVRPAGAGSRAASLQPPPRPPVPGTASPLWMDTVGNILPQPASTPTTIVTSALPDRALEVGPGLVFEQLRRAELRRAGQLTTETLTGAQVRTVGPVPANVTLGGGIRYIGYRVTESGSHRVHIAGTTIARPSGALAQRIPYTLPDPQQVFGPRSRMERLHLYPAAFGDTTSVGEAYGSLALNDAMQRLEFWLEANGGIRRGKVDVEVSAIIEMRPGPLDQLPYPHLRRATYSWTEGPETVTFSVGIDDNGLVYIMKGLGEGENLLPLFPRRNQ